jgi:tetratricopeptide (TPR) repeat protein
VEQTIVPSDFAELEGATSSLDPERRRAARERLAALLATLGLYARAEAIDRRALREDPDSLSAARRLVWSLLRQGRAAESLAAAEVLESIAEPQDALSAGIVAAAREAARPGADAAGIAARLPVFARQQIPWVLTGLREPEARSPASPP